jgi:dCTP deaminase
MSFLPQSIIKDRITQKSELVSSRFEEKYLQQASYDLRLGEEVYIVGRRAPEKLTERNPYLSIPPGQFALLTTYEEIKIPSDILALIAVRNRFKIQGLINISGFHVDPSYEGKLLFAVQNVGPTDVRLKFREPTFSIFFATLEKGDIGKGRNDQDVEFKHLKGIQLQNVQLLGGSSLTLAKLQKDLDRIRMLILIYGPFAVAATIALIVLLIRLFLKQ